MSHNKMNRKSGTFLPLLIMVSIILGSLIFSGCTGNRNRPQVLNVYTGTQGVSIKLTENNPPTEVYENSDIILMAEVWNKGAYTPSNVPVGGIPADSPIYISINVDPIYLDITNTLVIEDNFNRANRVASGSIDSLYLAGKSEAWPTGEKTIRPLAQVKVLPIPGTRESPTTQIDISACYEYKTFFSQNICVDTDMYQIDTQPICRNQREYTFSGQGAPLTITKLEVDMIPIGIQADAVPSSVPVVGASGELEEINRGQTAGKSLIVQPSFRIYFTNTDKGVVLNTKYFDMNYANNPCVVGASKDGRAMKISAYLGDKELKCTDAEVRMYSNEASVRCWLPEERIPPEYTLNRNFELPLKIEAEYFYRTTTTKDIKIIRVI